MDPGKRFAFVGRTWRAFVDVWAGLGFSVRQTVAFALGLIALVGSIGVFARVTDDVSEHNGMSSGDSMHLHWFIDHRSSGIDTIARWLSAFGSPPVLALIAVASAIVLWLIGKKVLLAIAPGVALAIAATGVALGKQIVGRARPPVALHLANESDASFPSGHASDTTALLVTLALVLALYVLRRPLARAIPVVGALLLSFAVGIGRLFLGVHWPTDVIAGWALGFSVALAVTLAVSVALRAVPGDPEPMMKWRPVRRIVHLMNHERHPQPLQAAYGPGR